MRLLAYLLSIQPLIGHAHIAKERIVLVQNQDPAPIVDAIHKGDDQSAINLVSSGMYDLDTRDASGNTPLIIAAQLKRPKVVAALLENNADLTLKNNARYTALYIVVRNGPEAILEQLVEAHKKRNIPPDTRCWFYVISYEEPKTMQLLIAAGADVNQKIRDGMTGLMWAAFMGYSTNAEKLIAAGADLNLKDSGGDTALLIASFFGHHTIVEKLIAAGAELNYKDRYGKTALGWARIKGDAKVIKMLEDAGAKE